MTGLSSFVVVLAVLTAIAVAVLTLGLLGVILAIRVLHTRRRIWREKVLGRWRALMTRALVQEPTRVPSLSRAEAPEVLPQWAYFHEFLRGDCKDNLNRLARLAGIDIHAKRRLRGDSVRQKLIAIQVLGSLRDRESRRLLRPLVSDPNPYLSLASAHAMLRISPRESMNELVPVLASRSDWPPGRVISMLREAGPEVVSEPLAEAAVSAGEAYQPLLIIYLDTAEESVAMKTIKRILLQCTDQQIIVTCLYQLSKLAHPESLRVLRTYLEDTNWLVQLHAVAGVGRLGGEADIDDLTRMLRHKEYWIRVRAAQALSKLPTMNVERLREIRSIESDAYARDILTEVIAEAGVAA